MKTKIITLLMGLVFVVLLSQGQAEKDKSFCFRHKETRAMVRSCASFKSDNDAYTRIYCMGADDTMKPFKPANMDNWERLEGDICIRDQSGKDVPRGMKPKTIHLFSGCRAK